MDGRQRKAWWRRAAARIGVAIAAGLALGSTPALPAARSVVLRYDFAEDAAEWQTTFPGATLESLQNAQGLRPGIPALQFVYTPNATVSPAFFTVTERSAAGARGVGFWIRSSAGAPVQFALGERDGSGYYYPIQCPVNEWTRVLIPLSDLSPDPGAPATDPDRHFHPEQLRAIRFQEVSRYHSEQAPTGLRRLYVVRMEYMTEQVLSRHQSRHFEAGPGVTLDTFDSEALGWEANNCVAAATARVEGRGVARLVYRQGATRLPRAILTHLDGTRLLAGLQSLRIVLRSQRDAQLQVRLMEYRPEYNSVTYEATMPVAAGRGWRPVYLRASDFHLAPGAADPHRRLDPSKVWLVQIGDAATTDPPAENVLELDEVAAVRGGME